MRARLRMRAAKQALGFRWPAASGACAGSEKSDGKAARSVQIRRRRKSAVNRARARQTLVPSGRRAHLLHTVPIGSSPCGGGACVPANGVQAARGADARCCKAGVQMSGCVDQTLSFA
eukprot:IDg16734t1